jgi:hypothetical protein
MDCRPHTHIFVSYPLRDLLAFLIGIQNDTRRILPRNLHATAHAGTRANHPTAIRGHSEALARLRRSDSNQSHLGLTCDRFSFALCPDRTDGRDGKQESPAINVDTSAGLRGRVYADSAKGQKAQTTKEIACSLYTGRISGCNAISLPGDWRHSWHTGLALVACVTADYLVYRRQNQSDAECVDQRRLLRAKWLVHSGQQKQVQGRSVLHSAGCSAVGDQGNLSSTAAPCLDVGIILHHAGQAIQDDNRTGRHIGNARHWKPISSYSQVNCVVYSAWRRKCHVATRPLLVGDHGTVLRSANMWGPGRDQIHAEYRTAEHRITGLKTVHLTSNLNRAANYIFASRTLYNQRGFVSLVEWSLTLCSRRLYATKSSLYFKARIAEAFYRRKTCLRSSLGNDSWAVLRASIYVAVFAGEGPATRHSQTLSPSDPAMARLYRRSSFEIYRSGILRFIPASAVKTKNPQRNDLGKHRYKALHLTAESLGHCWASQSAESQSRQSDRFSAIHRATRSDRGFSRRKFHVGRNRQMDGSLRSGTCDKQPHGNRSCHMVAVAHHLQLEYWPEDRIDHACDVGHGRSEKAGLDIFTCRSVQGPQTLRGILSEQTCQSCYRGSAVRESATLSLVELAQESILATGATPAIACIDRYSTSKAFWISCPTAIFDHLADPAQLDDCENSIRPPRSGRYEKSLHQSGCGSRFDGFCTTTEDNTTRSTNDALLEPSVASSWSGGLPGSSLPRGLLRAMILIYGGPRLTKTSRSNASHRRAAHFSVYRFAAKGSPLTKRLTTRSRDSRGTTGRMYADRLGRVPVASSRELGVGPAVFKTRKRGILRSYPAPRTSCASAFNTSESMVPWRHHQQARPEWFSVLFHSAAFFT